MIAAVLNWIGGFFTNLFSILLTFFKNLFSHLFNGLISVIKLIFKPILILVAIIFYFIYQLGVLVIKLVQVLVGIGKLIYSFVMGIIKTITGLVWTPTSPDHGNWTGAISNVFAGLEHYQLDKLAYVLLFAIWIMTAVAALKVLSGRGEG